MNTKVRKVLMAGAATVALLAAGGCASTSDLEAVRATAVEALNEARAAKTAADGAAATANEAKSIAGNAQNTANRAAQAASEAQACCAANTDRIERMFKKSMSK